MFYVMPPKSKRYKNSGTSKENACVSIKSKPKDVCVNVKSPRKALADKTNSASDDNEPLVSPKHPANTRKVISSLKSASSKLEEVDKVRTRRNRKPPKPLVDNKVLTKSYGNQNKPEKNNSPVSRNSRDEGNHNKNRQIAVVVITPLEIPKQTVETSLADGRPKRICRLPSKFDDHSISPSKFVPVKPIQASTPLVKNKDLMVSSKVNVVKDKIYENRKLRQLRNKARNKENFKDNSSGENNSKNEEESVENLSTRKFQTTKPLPRKQVIWKTQIEDKENIVANKKISDTNNNAKVLIRNKKVNNVSSHSIDINKKCDKGNRFLDKDYSFKVLDDAKKASKRNASNLDVYEFTFDPNEEPPPQKKKRKRVVRKKQEKPKTLFTNNYDKNVTKSLAALKNILSTKSSQSKQKSGTTKIQNKITSNTNVNVKNKTENIAQQQNSAEKNFNSFHVEDIVLNHESVVNDHVEINYSPINSPNHIRLPSEPRHDGLVTKKNNVEGIAMNKDPLNLQDDLSFFDESPAASSSLNLSTRNPSATPWRVEFGHLPIKWQVNTYVKANMTPAFESSFINFSDDKKKHVYTNIVPGVEGCNEPLPEIVDSNTSRLKQTSIISFIKEVVEKSERKKSKLKSTPVKGNSLFEDISNTSIYTTEIPPKNNSSSSSNKSATPKKNKSSENGTNSADKMSVSDNENSTETLGNNEKNDIDVLSKIQSKKKNKDFTFFGFDESDEQDQENASPNKKIDTRRIRALRPRSRAILKEFNAQAGPTQVPIPTTAKTNKSNENANINSIFNKLASNAQVVSEKTVDNNSETTNDADNAIIANSANFSQEDSQSVHLFEDLDVVHHIKPSRRSYGKAKKVTFRQNSVSSDTQESGAVGEQGASSEEEDNLEDLTFQIPSEQPKKSQRKKKTKQQLTKKEEKEAEAWAAGFNSMCEDVDEFDLVVE